MAFISHLMYFYIIWFYGVLCQIALDCVLIIVWSLEMQIKNKNGKIPKIYEQLCVQNYMVMMSCSVVKYYFRHDLCREP